MILFLIAVLAGVLIFFSPLTTRYIQRDAFRAAMEDETAKGLHFSSGHYSPIRRMGALVAESEGFQASNGERALKSLYAHGITARFNPWGVFVRQWRFSDVHLESGEVAIQIYEANPEAIKPKPWFSIFLPNRVFLKHIESERSDITWQFRGERAGFFGTQLLITLHGPDFEYFASGGRLKMALVPEHIVAVWAARHFSCAVAWIEDRLENLTASAHSRDQRLHLRGAFDSEGKLLGLDADVLCNVGAYSSFPATCGVEPLMALADLPGPYRVPEYRVRARGGFCRRLAPRTNAAPRAQSRIRASDAGRQGGL